MLKVNRMPMSEQACGHLCEPARRGRMRVPFDDHRGCASRSPRRPPPSPRPGTAAAAPGPAVDPIEALIAESNRHFDIGQSEVQAGHLEAARPKFNRALELVMQWSTGPRSEPRLRDHFDRLVERVSAVEILALAEGDGFAEQRSEPAAIDALLDTPDTTVATAETARRAESDLESTQYDITIPLNDRGVVVSRSYSAAA